MPTREIERKESGIKQIYALLTADCVYTTDADTYYECQNARSHNNNILMCNGVSSIELLCELTNKIRIKHSSANCGSSDRYMYVCESPLEWKIAFDSRRGMI